jgi:hypothetical protein
MAAGQFRSFANRMGMDMDMGMGAFSTNTETGEAKRANMLYRREVGNLGMKMLVLSTFLTG